MVTMQFGLLGTVNRRRSAAAVPLSTRLWPEGTLLLEAQAAGIPHPSPRRLREHQGRLPVPFRVPRFTTTLVDYEQREANKKRTPGPGYVQSEPDKG